MRIGVLGGTFDPVHIGHLIIAQEALVQIGLAQVLFVPAHTSPLKRSPVASPEDRAAMVELAIRENPAFALSRVDLDRPGPSYTVETLAILRQAYGPGVDLCFIAGFDAVAELYRWREPTRLLELAEVIAVSRPGYKLVLPAQLAAAADRIRVVQAPQIGISATDIRRRCHAGLPIRYLVPDAVRAYIEAHALYREPNHQPDRTSGVGDAPGAAAAPPARPGAAERAED